MQGMTTSRTTSALAALAAASVLALTACGGGGSASSAPAGGSGGTISTTSVDGVGDILVDSAGNALYSPDQESGGMIACTGPCASVWVPVTVSGGDQPTGTADVEGKLGVVQRPDGSDQVTFDQEPLYTFAPDGGPGTVTGNGLSDTFGGTSFTWHVAAVGPVSGNATSTRDGYS